MRNYEKIQQLSTVKFGKGFRMNSIEAVTLADVMHLFQKRGRVVQIRT